MDLLYFHSSLPTLKYCDFQEVKGSNNTSDSYEEGRGGSRRVIWEYQNMLHNELESSE